MSQISFDNFSGGPAGSAAGGSGTSLDLLCLLIEGIGKHAVDEDPEELARFQQSVAVETDRLRQAASPDQMKPSVDAVIDLMASHNEAVKTDHLAHASELTVALRMMTETIGFVGKSSQAAVHQLAVIQKNLEEVTATPDAKNLRMKLGVCLKMIREQSESLQVQSEAHLNQLKAFVASSSAAHQAGLLEEALDAVTGVPGRVFAENLIQDKFVRKTDCIVGVIKIDRYNNFLTKYGQAAADDVIKAVAQQTAQRLPVGSTLCRWSPNSLIAITEITSSYAETAQQWRKVNGIKIEKNFDDGPRSAFVMLATSLSVEHLRVIASRRSLVQNMDRFVAQQSGELAA